MFTVLAMHPTTKRLYEALQALLGVDEVGSTLAAKTLRLESAQTVNNWERRGVAKNGIVTAASLCGIRPAWIQRAEMPMLDKQAAPASLPPEMADYHPHQAAESASPWSDEARDVRQALSMLEAAMARLDFAGRERIAPLFTSFARGSGSVVKDDIVMLLTEGFDNTKSPSSGQAGTLQKTR